MKDINSDELDFRYENVPERERRKFIMCKHCGSCKHIKNFRVIEIEETEYTPSMTKYNDYCMKCDLKMWIISNNITI